MRQIKNKHRKRTHLLVNVVLRTSWFQYTGRQMGPNKTETMCWLDKNRRGRIRCYNDRKNDRAIISGSTAGITQLLIRRAYIWRESA